MSRQFDHLPECTQKFAPINECQYQCESRQYEALIQLGIKELERLSNLLLPRFEGKMAEPDPEVIARMKTEGFDGDLSSE